MIRTVTQSGARLHQIAISHIDAEWLTTWVDVQPPDPNHRTQVVATVHEVNSTTRERFSMRQKPNHTDTLVGFQRPTPNVVVGSGSVHNGGHVYGRHDSENAVNYWESIEFIHLWFDVPSALQSIAGAGSVEMLMALDLGLNMPMETTRGKATTISWRIDVGEVLQAAAVQWVHEHARNPYVRSLIFRVTGYLKPKLGNIHIRFTWDQIRKTDTSLHDMKVKMASVFFTSQLSIRYVPGALSLIHI